LVHGVQRGPTGTREGVCPLSRLEKAVIGAAVALAAGYVWLLQLWPESARVVAGHIALTVAPATAAASCLLAARRAARRALGTWVLLAAASLCVAAGQGLWFFAQFGLGREIAFPSPSFFLFIAFHPIFALALIRSLRRDTPSDSPVDLVHDGMLAAAAIAAFMLRFLFEPLLASRPWLSYGDIAWIVGGQFVAQLSLVAAGALVVWRRATLSPRATAALVTVAIVNSTANLLVAAGADPDVGNPGDAFDLLWLSGWLLLAWAGAIGAQGTERIWSGRGASYLSRRRRQAVAPAAALALTAIIVDIAIRGETGPETAVAVGLLAMLLAARIVRSEGAFERERQERRELARTRVLVDLSRTLAAAPRVEDALTQVLDSARQLLSAERAWVERPEADHVRVLAGADAEAATLASAASCGSWLGGRRSAQKLIGPNEPCRGPGGAPLPARRWIAAATIRFGERHAGTLIVERDDTGFDDAEIDLLGALSDQAAVAIENARLIDEARQSERALLRNEKLASIGRLAAGVAHEINNPLAAIQAAAELLNDDGVAAADPEPLDIIRSESRRVGEIVRRMLDFVQPSDVSVTAVAIADLVSATIRLRAYDQTTAGIRTVVRLDGLPPVAADRGQLQQVVLNLIVNAEHALAGGRADRTIEITGQVVGDDVIVHFHDNGSGIAPEDIGRVFDPFFTTKPPGVGTGLGLSVSYGILRELGGGITVESRPGVGTTFLVRLPMARGPAQDAAVKAGGDTAPPPIHVGGPLSVLLVDDEASIRELVSRFLRRRGHHVETAANGRAALDAVATRAYDVILTDLKMPELDGEELYARLVAMDALLPDRVLFMSGDTVADATRDFLSRTARPFVSKPFDLEVLASRIAEVGAARGHGS
jgi:signal transduction histidine kinase